MMKRHIFKKPGQPLKIITVLLVTLVLLFTQSSGVSVALSKDQKRALQSGIYYFDTEEASCLGGAGGNGPLYGPAFPKISDTAALANKIKEYIQSVEPASGLVNNSEDFVRLGQQYNVNPVMLVLVGQKETQLGTDGGIGNPPKHNFWGNRSGSGWATYPNYAASIEGYYKNLRENPAYAKVWAKGDAATVTDIIFIATPPSDGNDTTNYVKFVNDVMQKILEGLGTDGANATTTRCGGGGGLVNPEGYSFPLEPQKKIRYAGVPCDRATCHHDNTAASDLSYGPADQMAGKKVYAISDGVATRIKPVNVDPNCKSIQFKSSKDNYYYWYGHVQNVTIQVNVPVKAGQQIAEVSKHNPNLYCNSDGAHLHIDRGCVKNGAPQPGGGEECRDPSFIEFMNKMWEGLPS